MGDLLKTIPVLHQEGWKKQLTVIMTSRLSLGKGSAKYVSVVFLKSHMYTSNPKSQAI